MSQEGAFDNIKPSSFENVFMAGIYMDSDEFVNLLASKQAPDSFLSDSSSGALMDHTIAWDKKGVICCQPCPGKNVYGVIHRVE